MEDCQKRVSRPLMLLCLVIGALVPCTSSQDYQVADISCMFPGPSRTGEMEGSERLVARLRKPPGFKGHPLFADDRRIDPFHSAPCQIRPDPLEPSGLIYNLVVTNFERCATVKKDGYVHVRVWFPQLMGVVLATDQEVVIMCQPASPTIIENRAAGFAGSLPQNGRVSGVVEESPGRLEYEVALFRESQARSDSQSPVDQAVPIGSRLQLRARINTKSAWKYAKLMGVTVSGDQHDPFSPGHVELVKQGCRLPEFVSIVPQQPRRPEEQPGEVQLDFQAFMLDSRLAGSSKLWIHATIKACIEAQDCLPEFCLDLFQPSGHGRRRRSFAGGTPPVLLEVGDQHSLSLAEIMERNTNPNYTDAAGEMYSKPADALTIRRGGAGHRYIQQNQPPQSIESSPFGGFGHYPPSLGYHEPPPLASKPTPPSPRGRGSSSTSLADNVGVTVIMPDELFSGAGVGFVHESCSGLLVLLGVVTAGAMGTVALLCLLSGKLRRLQIQQATPSSFSSTLKQQELQKKSKYPAVRYLLQ